MKIFLGTPMYSNACLTDGHSGSCWTSCLPGGWVERNGGGMPVPQFQPSSLLPKCFNQLWMAAVEGKADFFVMLHADIFAESGWIDKLLETMEKMSATMISAGVRIKDASYEYSTALDLDPKCENPFHLLRLHAEHLSQLPHTYSNHDVAKVVGAKEYSALLLNTGCFAVDLRDRSWIKCTPFQLNAYNDWGQSKTFCDSEDWYLSRMLWRLGKRVYGTRLVRTQHLGAHAYDSHELEIRQAKKKQEAECEQRRKATRPDQSSPPPEPASSPARP